MNRIIKKEDKMKKTVLLGIISLIVLVATVNASAGIQDPNSPNLTPEERAQIRSGSGFYAIGEEALYGHRTGTTPIINAVEGGWGKYIKPPMQWDFGDVRGFFQELQDLRTWYHQERQERLAGVKDEIDALKAERKEALTALRQQFLEDLREAISNRDFAKLREVVKDYIEARKEIVNTYGEAIKEIENGALAGLDDEYKEKATELWHKYFGEDSDPPEWMTTPPVNHDGWERLRDWFDGWRNWQVDPSIRDEGDGGSPTLPDGSRSHGSGSGSVEIRGGDVGRTHGSGAGGAEIRFVPRMGNSRDNGSLPIRER